MVEKESLVVGLIPLAVGGSELSRWLPSGDLYSIALFHAKEAQGMGVIKGILWHQGESDADAPNLAGSYAQRFAHMINKFRTELGDPNIPVVVSTLGQFIDRYRQGKGLCCYREVNRQIEILPKYVKNLGVVHTHGLIDRGDGIHFDAQSQIELGKRYATAMRKLTEKTRK